MAATKKKTSSKDQKPKGRLIPAGTEQETGLTRAKTEKPGAKKPAPKKGENISKKLS
jgi:hypothetical protein